MKRKISNVSYSVSLSEAREHLRRVERRIQELRQQQADVKAGRKTRQRRGRKASELPPSQYTEREQHEILERLHELQKARRGKRGVHAVVYRRIRNHDARGYLKIEGLLVRPLKGFKPPERITFAQYMAMKACDVVGEFVEVLHLNSDEIFPPHRWYHGIEKPRKLSGSTRSAREVQQRYLNSLGLPKRRRQRGDQKPISTLSLSGLCDRRRRLRSRLGLPPLPRGYQRTGPLSPASLARYERLTRKRAGLSRPSGRPRIPNPKPATIKARARYARATASKRAA